MIEGQNKFGTCTQQPLYIENVHLPVSANAMSRSHGTNPKFIQPCRRGEDGLLMFRWIVKFKKGILVTLNVAWMLLSERLVWVFPKLIDWDFHTGVSISRVDRGWSQKENIQWAAVPCWCQRSEWAALRLVGDYRKATIPSLSAHIKPWSSVQLLHEVGVYLILARCT